MALSRDGEAPAELHGGPAGPSARFSRESLAADKWWIRGPADELDFGYSRFNEFRFQVVGGTGC